MLPTTAAGTRGGISGGPCVSATKLLSSRLSLETFVLVISILLVLPIESLAGFREFWKPVQAIFHRMCRAVTAGAGIAVMAGISVIASA